MSDKKKTNTIILPIEVVEHDTAMFLRQGGATFTLKGKGKDEGQELKGSFDFAINGSAVLVEIRGETKNKWTTYVIGVEEVVDAIMRHRNKD